MRISCKFQDRHSSLSTWVRMNWHGFKIFVPSFNAYLSFFIYSKLTLLIESCELTKITVFYDLINFVCSARLNTSVEDKYTSRCIMKLMLIKIRRHDSAYCCSKLLMAAVEKSKDLEELFRILIELRVRWLGQVNSNLPCKIVAQIRAISSILEAIDWSVQRSDNCLK